MITYIKSTNREPCKPRKHVESVGSPPLRTQKTSFGESPSLVAWEAPAPTQAPPRPHLKPAKTGILSANDWPFTFDYWFKFVK